MRETPQIGIQGSVVEKDDVYIYGAWNAFIRAAHPAKLHFQRANDLFFEQLGIQRCSHQHRQIKKIRP